MQTFRKNLKQAHDAKHVATFQTSQVAASQPAAVQVTTSPQEGQQFMASDKLPGASTVEATKEGQQLAASEEQLEASTVEATKEGQQPAASGELPGASTVEATKEGQQPAAKQIVTYTIFTSDPDTETGTLPPPPLLPPSPRDTTMQTVAAAEEKPVADTTMQASPGMQPGSIVVGTSSKWKEKYDGHKSKVITLLSKHVKVEILEGPAKGEVHKYSYDSVKRVAPRESSGSATPPDASSDAASAPSASSGSASAPAASAATASAPVASDVTSDEPVVTDSSFDVSELWPTVWGSDGQPQAAIVSHERPQ